MPAPSVLVEGIQNSSGVSPPDPNGDIGATQYVQAVNSIEGSLFSVFAKDGSLLDGPKVMSDLWADVGGGCENKAKGDPIIQYDQLAGRWLITQFAFEIDIFGNVQGPYFECIWISSSSDALGDGTAYSFLIDAKFFPDFPKIGVWHDAYYASFHLFNKRGQYAGQAFIAFDRDSMLAGAEAREIRFIFNEADFGALPSDAVGPVPPPAGTPNYFVVVKDDNLGAKKDRIIIYPYHVNWDDIEDTFVGQPTKLPTLPFNSKLCGGSFFCIKQGGTDQRLDALGGFPGAGDDGGMFLGYPLSYRNFGDSETLVFNHSVKLSANNRSGLRWYQINDPGGTPAIAQQGTHAPADSLSRWVGSTGIDGDGNLALGYSTSSKKAFPSIAYTGRLATDPPGTMGQGEGILMPGGGPQTGSDRWGDYTSMMVDPVDDCTFWYTNEFYPKKSKTKWHTTIAAFKFPSCQ
ncbi:MAG: hypothetical protein ACRDJI_02550 [Actinomycetota bacterium]